MSARHVGGVDIVVGSVADVIANAWLYGNCFKNSIEIAEALGLDPDMPVDRLRALVAEAAYVDEIVPVFEDDPVAMKLGFTPVKPGVALPKTPEHCHRCALKEVARLRALVAEHDTEAADELRAMAEAALAPCLWHGTTGGPHGPQPVGGVAFCSQCERRHDRICIRPDRILAALGAGRDTPTPDPPPEGTGGVGAVRAAYDTQDGRLVWGGAVPVREPTCTTCGGTKGHWGGADPDPNNPNAPIPAIAIWKPCPVCAVPNPESSPQ